MNTSILRGTAVYVVLVLVLLAAISPVLGFNGPTPIICTDKAVYYEGDKIQATLSGWHYGPTWPTANNQPKFDVYVGLWTSFGWFFCLDPQGAWSTSMVPCSTNQGVVSGAEFYAVQSASFVVPPKTPPGLYALGIVVTRTGSPSVPLRWASELNVIFFWVATPSAQHYYVNSQTGNDSNNGTAGSPWQTITHALSQVSPVDLLNHVTIHVAEGTYSQAANGETFPLELKCYVHLRGEEGGDKPILDAGKNAYHVIVCRDEDYKDWSMVTGFTITGGKADGLKFDDKRGGGVYCPKGYKIVLQNNIIEDNVAEYGAGIHLTDSFAIVHHNSIQGNEAFKRGGGIGCEQNAGGSILCNKIRQNGANSGAGVSCDQSKPEIRNNVIANNKAKESGGGIRCESMSLLIAGNMIKENKVLATSGKAEGGGIFCYDGSSPTITNNAIIANDVKGLKSRGGGIFSDSSKPKILKNVIYGNKATGSVYGKGGGIYCYGGSLEVKDCTIFDNKTSSHGGGICCDGTYGSIRNNTIYGNVAANADGGGIYWGSLCPSPPQILSNTIADNHADKASGGGIWVGQNTGLTIKDCIIYLNTDSPLSVSDQLHLPSSVKPSHCCIENWSGGGTNNISNNPKFVTGPYGRYYLNHLAPNQSKCIDAGSQTAAMAGLSELTTNPDVTILNKDGSDVDMGCHYPIIH